MDAMKKAIETFKRLGLKPFSLIYGNLAGPSQKENRRQIVWSITGKKPTLAESRLGIVEDLLFKTFQINNGCNYQMEQDLINKLKSLGFSID